MSKVVRVEQKSIDETLAGLAAKFDRTPETSNRSNVIFFNGIKREAVIELLDAAHSAIQENQESAAWSYLVQASEHLGYLIGINEAESLTTPEQAINAKLPDTRHGNIGRVRLHRDVLQPDPPAWFRWRRVTGRV